MEFILRPSYFFLEQIEDISTEAARIIEDKLKLVKINPFRYKRIQGYKLFLFRIRFENNRREKRVIYLISKHYVKILCILDGDKEYKDLQRYLKKLGYL